MQTGNLTPQPALTWSSDFCAFEFQFQQFMHSTLKTLRNNLGDALSRGLGTEVVGALTKYVKVVAYPSMIRLLAFGARAGVHRGELYNFKRHEWRMGNFLLDSADFSKGRQAGLEQTEKRMQGHSGFSICNAAVSRRGNAQRAVSSFVYEQDRAAQAEEEFAFLTHIDCKCQTIEITLDIRKRAPAAFGFCGMPATEMLSACL